jgi:ribonuclease HII
MLLARYQKEFIEAGCDEAGRGCLAGPVFAAAVILPHNFKHKLLNDSKLIAEERVMNCVPRLRKKPLPTPWPGAII